MLTVKQHQAGQAGQLMIGSMCPEPAASITSKGFHATHNCTSYPPPSRPWPSVASVLARAPASTAHPSAARAETAFDIRATAPGLGGTMATVAAESQVKSGP